VNRSGSALHALADALGKAGEEAAAARAAEPEAPRNLRALQAFYSAVARGDWASAEAGLCEDCSFEVFGYQAQGYHRMGRGRAQVLAHLRSNVESTELDSVETRSVFAGGDSVIVFTRERGLWRPSGERFERDDVLHHLMREGRIARYRVRFFEPGGRGGP
jgi:ketosteroid isomerase-like protein